jgi:hypothetical protein
MKQCMCCCPRLWGNELHVLLLYTLPPPRSLDPAAFVEGLKKKGIRVPGIGHRIKSKVRGLVCWGAGVRGWGAIMTSKGSGSNS